MAYKLIYVTASSRDEARRLGRTVVEERLAACANILGSIESCYHWRGQIEESEETALVLKTRGDLVDALAKRIVELHSYEVPCVVALPIEGGNPAFLDWIKTETGPQASIEVQAAASADVEATIGGAEPSGEAKS